MTTLSPLLSERAKTHGDFSHVAHTAGQLKLVLEACENWERLSPEQCETLHMVCSKLARIMHGNHNFLDHWEDCAGYFQLVVDKLASPK